MSSNIPPSKPTSTKSKSVRNPGIRNGAILPGIIVSLLIGLMLAQQAEVDRLRRSRPAVNWKERGQGEDEYIGKFSLFKRGPRDKKEICLTLDDGPHGQCTVDELAALRAAGVKATFFVVGKRMREHPDLIREMIAEGMEVGNHTQNHPALDKMPLEKVRSEVEKCEALFLEITGRQMNLFRPPHMRENPAILGLVKKMGYTTVSWNTGAQDFMVSRKDPGVTNAMIESLKATPDQIADRITGHVINGAIILLHDQPVTAAALPKILSTLQKAGYRFVTCAEAMSHLDHPQIVVANPMASPEKLASLVKKKVKGGKPVASADEDASVKESAGD
jgi:peptidoglycan-N-acetylglucosamine deacetylase